MIKNQTRNKGKPAETAQAGKWLLFAALLGIKSFFPNKLTQMTEKYNSMARLVHLDSQKGCWASNTGLVDVGSTNNDENGHLYLNWQIVAGLGWCAVEVFLTEDFDRAFDVFLDGKILLAWRHFLITPH